MNENTRAFIIATLKRQANNLIERREEIEAELHKTVAALKDLDDNTGTAKQEPTP